MTGIRRFGGRLALAEALARNVASSLDGAIADRGRASLVVPGGSSPASLFAALSRQPLDWPRVTVTLTDERLVPAGHPDRNAALVESELLQGAAAAANRVFPAAAEAGSIDSAGYRLTEQERLRSLPQPFDAAVLGMGDDGHFASLFPGSPELPAALDPHGGALTTILEPPAAAHRRLSLTLAPLAGSRRLALLIFGEAKRHVLERALDPAADPLELPVAALLRATGERLTVYWAE